MGVIVMDIKTKRPKTALYHKIYCEAYGLTEIPTGYCVHHIDCDPWNNDVDNLMLLTRSEHTILHNLDNKYSLGRKASNETKEKMSKTHVGLHVGSLNGNYREITEEMLNDYLDGITQSKFVRKYKINRRKYVQLKNNLEYYINLYKKNRD